MTEIEIVKFHVETTVNTVQTNILRYYDVLHELKRMSLFLLNETTVVWERGFKNLIWKS